MSTRQTNSFSMFQDGESGWSSLHRALHFGHLAVASMLLQSTASIILEDSKLRTPIDLLSGPVRQVIGDGDESGLPFSYMLPKRSYIDDSLRIVLKT